MGRIQSSIGLVTGTDIRGTVDQLIAISAQPRDRLLARIKTSNDEQAAYTELMTLVIGVQLAGRSFASESLFQSRRGESSNADAVSVTANNGATVGNYRLRTLQTAATHLAQSEQSFASATEALGLDGSLKIATGGFLGNSSTSLSSLNGGRGVDSGSIKITDRSGASATIDLSKARTIDDVLQTINETSGISVEASATAERIVLRDVSGESSFNLRVEEVGDGETAADLGLWGINTASATAEGNNLTELSSSQVLASNLSGLGVRLAQGNDLNFQLADGTTFDLDLNPDAGTPATTLVDMVDAINELDPTKLVASLSNDNRLVIEDLTSGSDEFTIRDTQGADVASALRIDRDAVNGEITSRSLVSPLRGTTLEDLGGGRGIGELTSIDIELGDGSSANVDFSTAQTIEEVIDRINASGIAVRARINDAGTGIRLRDLSGAQDQNFRISSSDDTANSLGIAFDSDSRIVDGSSLQNGFVTRSTLLSDLNQGRGIGTGSFTVRDSNNASAQVTIPTTGITTVGELIDAINELEVDVTASLNETGDGIAIVDNANGTGEFRISDNGSTEVAKSLGIAGVGQSQTFQGATVKAIVGGEFETIDFSNTDSLEDVAQKINDSSRFATASVATDDGGRSRLVIQSRRGGEIGRLSIDSTVAPLEFSTINQGRDAEISIQRGSEQVRFESSSDGVFNLAEDGISLTVKELSEEPIELNVTRNTETATRAMNTFVEQFNRLNDRIDALTFFNAQTQEVGLLFGASDVNRIDQSFGRLFSGRVNGAGAIRSFNQIGLRMNSQGDLAFDSSKFLAALDENPDAVVEFFTKEETGIAARVRELGDQIAGVNQGFLLTRTRTLTDQLERQNSRVASMNLKLQRERDRLLKQFNGMEEAIAKMQSNQSVVSSIQRLTIPDR